MNIYNFMRDKLTTPPAAMTADQVKRTADSEQMKDFVRKFGVTIADARKAIEANTLVMYERNSIYQAIDRSLVHPLMSAATAFYADTATTRSSLMEGTAWVTSDNKEYQYQIEKLFDIINLEEVIYDWAWQITTFGDLFVEVHGEPGIGIISVSDDQHPANVSRVDFNGRLVGFYETPYGYNSPGEHKLMPPWIYCLAGNTKVDLLDGTSPTIMEMANNRDKYIGKYVLSINPATLSLEPDRIIEVKCTGRNEKLIRIHLDNEQYVDCTPEHKFMLRDGTYEEAQDLMPGDSLMPLYSKVTPKGGYFHDGYDVVYNPATKKLCYEHRLVSKFINGPTPKGCVIHHKDFTKLNNDPSNLQVMTSNSHSELHNSLIHKGDCQCGFCKIKRGEIKHASSCLCCICETKRGNPRRGVNNSSHRKREVVECACGCGQTFKRVISDSNRGRKKYVWGHYKSTTGGNANHYKSTCPCTACRNERKDPPANVGWLSIGSRKCQYCESEFDGRLCDFANHVRCCNKSVAILNHKVVGIEKLVGRHDVYDLETERNHNFPLVAGVFVHNCHFRALGAKRRKPLYGGDPSWTEYRTINLLTPDIRRLTAKYGQSSIGDALPILKRLRLAEDSILMSRIGRGVLRYIWKVKIEGSNHDSAAAIIDSYVSELKRARSIDTSASNPAFQDRFSSMASMEDLILPVWGDTNNLAVEKIGEDVDIRWIADVKELTNQLACALRIPLPLLGGYLDQLPASLGQSSTERLDIRFARQARRIQRAIITGLTRLAQIHLAYQGMNPDLKLFQIQMAETSSAEEEELKNALDKGVDVCVKLADMAEQLLGPDLDKRELFDYLNTKFLKLNDMDLEKLILKVNPAAFKETRTEEPVPGLEAPAGVPAESAEPNPFRESLFNSDLKSALPSTAGSPVTSGALWESLWRDKKVRIDPIKEPASV